VSDIDTVVVDSLKVLDPERPIREADISLRQQSRIAVLALDACAGNLLSERRKKDEDAYRYREEAARSGSSESSSPMKK
jgi:hypothetical protein